MGHETLIKCTDSHNLAWDNYEKAIDRVVAIAHSSKRNEIGSLLLRVEALDDASLRKVVALISRSLVNTHKITRIHGTKIALAVIREHLHPGCHQCGGKGELYRDEAAVISCHVCSGTGYQRYTDKQRLSLVGSKYDAKAYSDGLDIVRDALSNIVRMSNGRLSWR